MSTTAEHEPARRSRCWCCGAELTWDQLVHLGDHPEVGVCFSCARYLHRRAVELQDQNTSGPARRFRSMVRAGRNQVVARSWHQRPVLGRSLRWIDRILP